MTIGNFQEKTGDYREFCFLDQPAPNTIPISNQKVSELTLCGNFFKNPCSPKLIWLKNLRAKVHTSQPYIFTCAMPSNEARYLSLLNEELSKILCKGHVCYAKHCCPKFHASVSTRIGNGVEPQLFSLRSLLRLGTHMIHLVQFFPEVLNQVYL